jgi:hypothetical protein
MAAHTRSLEFDCGAPGCAKKATVEVFTTWNDPIGKYCKPHGESRAEAMRRADEKAGR